MKKIIFIIMLIGMLIGITGCDSASTISYNLSREADEFHVKRSITFINLRSNEYLFQVTGNCSVKGGLENTNKELELVCRIGEDKYQKHFLHIADETTYVVEQLEYNDVSRYDYEFIFRPKAIIPVQIKTQISEN